MILKCQNWRFKPNFMSQKEACTTNVMFTEGIIPYREMPIIEMCPAAQFAAKTL